jgi:hypothetical protein
MSPNQALSIQLTNTDGTELRVENVVLDIYFFLKQKCRFGFRAATTDAAGHSFITYESVEALRRREAELQPWDYNTSLTDCDETIELRLPTPNELEQGAAAARAWGRDDKDLQNWLNAANRDWAAPPVQVTLVNGMTPIRVPCTHR